MPNELILPTGLDKSFYDLFAKYGHNLDIIVQGFFKIKNKQGEIVKFIYNNAQNLHRKRSKQFDRVLKARKCGISSKRIAKDILTCALKKHEHRIALTHSDDGSQVVMAERVVPFIKNCQMPLNAKTRQDYIYFPNTDSRYYVGTAGSKKFGRGDDITGRHFLETAHWESPDVMIGVDEALIENSDGLDETTANGHNFWKKLWEDSKRGRNKETAIFLPWYVCEDYRRDPTLETGPLSEEEQVIMKSFNLDSAQIAWRRWKKRTMSDPSLFAQEYPETDEEAFISTGRPVFDKVALAYCHQTVSEAKWRGYIVRFQDRVKFMPDPLGPLLIWKMPERGHIYAIGADVAEGLKEGCNSAGEVLDLGDSEQVAEWVGHISPDLFADALMLLADFYNGSIIIPESWPGVGEVTTSHLVREGAKVWENPERSRYGFETNQHTKTQMIALFNAALRDYSLTIRSPDLLEELHAYTYDDKMRMEPSIGNYSDRLMAMGIGYYCSREAATRIDYYAPKKISSLFDVPNTTGARVSVPKFRGPRIGVR